MPIEDGRLVCCQCGADLGDAEDIYRDPDCHECLDREMAAEAERDRRRDENFWSEGLQREEP